MYPKVMHRSYIPHLNRIDVNITLECSNKFATCIEILNYYDLFYFNSRLEIKI